MNKTFASLSVWRLVLLTVGLLAGISSHSASFALPELPGIGSKKDKSDDDQRGKKLLGLAKTATASQSDEQEIRAGEALAALYLGAAPVIKEENVIGYLNAILKRITEQTSRTELPWAVTMIDTPAINAFAAPGGKIILTTGLYNLLDTEDELAAVLSHEVAHVVLKHHWNIIKKQQLIGGATDLVADEVGGEAVTGAVFDKLKDVFKDLVTSGIDRGGELDADIYGVVFASRAGYDSTALLSVLEKINASTKAGTDSSLLFQTHPTPIQRSNHIMENFNAALERAAVPHPMSNRISTFFLSTKDARAAQATSTNYARSEARSSETSSSSRSDSEKETSFKAPAAVDQKPTQKDGPVNPSNRGPSATGDSYRPVAERRARLQSSQPIVYAASAGLSSMTESNWVAQVGAFVDKNNARRLLLRLGSDAFAVRYRRGGVIYNAVVLGPYNSLTSAKNAFQFREDDILVDRPYYRTIRAMIKTEGQRLTAEQLSQ